MTVAWQGTRQGGGLQRQDRYTICMTASTAKTITVDGVTLTVEVTYKRVKNVNARLEARTNTLLISAPRTMSSAMLEPIITDLARKLLRRVQADRANTEVAAQQLAQRVAARFPYSPNVARVLFVTTQQARWGSYSPATRTIRLHAALRHMPLWVLEAVVAHELAHVTHHNHGPEFWDLLNRVCSDTERANGFLAGVSWLGREWEQLPPVERSLLMKETTFD